MKNVNESGRSMVEMLGVLAIIGVLSIGGIAGYTLAMNRYRANEILNAASMVAIEAVARASTSANGSANVAYNSLGGMSNPTGASAIVGHSDGTVAINFDNKYPEVASLVNDLAGARAENCGNTTCTINTQKATRTTTTTTTTPGQGG